MVDNSGKEVPIAILISKPNNKTSVGTIKKPPPAPTKPVIKPTIIFQVLIPEDERNRRVKKRNEPLTKRDKRLTDDNVYRQALELERSKHGCIKLNLRLRDPETCALRVVQSLLGSKLVGPFSLNLK